MKNLWMPTWLAMASLCLLCSFAIPQMEDFGTSTIIVEGDIMLADSGDTELDITRATLVSSNGQYTFGGCNNPVCGYDISSVSPGTYSASLLFDNGSVYKQGIVVQ